MNFLIFPDDINLSNFDLFFLMSKSFVQFLHRLMAYFIIAVVVIFGVKLFIQKKTIFLNNYLNVFFVLILQVLLGIFTLISGLNLYLASLHQITSIILVFTVLNLNHKLS